MMFTKPKISRDFESFIQEKAIGGAYETNVDGIRIVVFAYVFPPQSPFSQSSHTIYDQFGDLDGQTVLDIGTGTGIQAIVAAIAGACQIDAIDINEAAVRCARYNAVLNSLENKITVWQSDLFADVPIMKYDLIIANLSIVDIPEPDLRLHSLYDPGFVYHERLFEQAPDYLSKNGKIVLCHANLQENAFDRLEEIAQKYNLVFEVRQKISSLGHEWRNYEFRYDGSDKK